MRNPLNKAIHVEPNEPQHKQVTEFMWRTVDQQRDMLLNQQLIDSLFREAGPQLTEWMQVVIDNWLTTEGRYCSQAIVDEFKRNIPRVLAMLQAFESRASQRKPFNSHLYRPKRLPNHSGQ